MHTWTFADHTNASEIVKSEQCGSRQEIAAMKCATFGIDHLLYGCGCALNSRSNTTTVTTGSSMFTVALVNYIIRFLMSPISNNLKLLSHKHNVITLVRLK